MSNPIDEALEYNGKEKTAGPFGEAASSFAGDFTRRLPGAMAGIGAQAAASAAVLALGGAAAKAYQAIQKRQAFKAMLEHNGDLRDMQQSDPAMFKRQFDSLQSLNPSFASDPIIAGTYMRQMSMSPNTAGKVLVESLEARQKSSPFELGMSGDKPTFKYRF